MEKSLNDYLTRKISIKIKTLTDDYFGAGSRNESGERLVSSGRLIFSYLIMLDK